MNAILAIAGADAAERMRRFAFMVTIAAALYVGYLYVPSPTSSVHSIVIDNHTGIYNSAFYGASLATLTAGFLALIGFYLVRGSVERDVECHVDGMVAASPVRKATFVLGKWLSNVAVLCAIAAVTSLAVMAVQVLRGGAAQFDFLAYAMPYLLITVPGMAFVAAVAVAFDLIPIVRGVFGGILYIFIWPTMISVPLAAKVTVADPLGFSVLSSNLMAAEERTFPGGHHQVSFGLIQIKHLGAPFLFSGFDWTSNTIGARIAWLAIAVLVVLLGSIAFDRYRRELTSKRGKLFVDAARLIPNLPFLRIFRAEFGLIASGASVWWYVGVIGLIVASFFVPMDTLTKVILPLALIWPLERISALGAREQRNGVEGVLASTPGFASKTLLNQWLAGTLLTVILCSTCVVRLMASGDALSGIACVAIAAAMAAIALALGSTFGNSRVFETVFLIVWYLGPVQRVQGFDFAAGMSTSPVLVTAIGSALAALALGATVAKRSLR